MSANSNANVFSPLPTSDRIALAWFSPALDLSNKQLRALPSKQFKKAWYAIAFLYSGLNPDEATDHGTEISFESNDTFMAGEIDPRLVAPYYVESGWPLVLEAIANEAWRRFDAGLLLDDELYCCDAQRAGLLNRNPHLADAG